MAPEVVAARVSPLSDYVDDARASVRFTFLLLGVFAAVAMTLACVGLFAVTAYSVGQQRLEIGVRKALGARDSLIVGMVVGRGLRVATIGVILGLASATLTTSALDSLLVGVGVRDPVTFGAISLLMLFVAVVACYVPALRANSVAPRTAMDGS